MANAKSTSIKVFPATKRGEFQRSARLFSEENVTNIVSTMSESFVKSFDAATEIITFIIHGYRFTLNLYTSELINTFGSKDKLYAYIELQNNVVEESNLGPITEEYWELTGQDDYESELYTGITFLDTDPEETLVPTANTRYYSLLLLQKPDNLGTTSSFSSWEVPELSMAHVNLEDIRGEFTEIFAGYIESRL